MKNVIHKVVGIFSKPLYALSIILWLWMLANGLSLIITGRDLMSPDQIHFGTRQSQIIVGIILSVFALLFLKASWDGLVYKPRKIKLK